MAKQKQPVAQGASKRRTTARKQTCILVLGMHRSGTSAVTRTIALFGAELPRGMLGSNPTNEAGHWEPERLIAYHDQLLGQLSSSWHDWRPLDMTRLAPERREKARADIRALIEADYPGSPLFVVKEPRICRFAGFFMEALDDARIDVVPIIAFRNPLEVVASLEKRSTIWPASYSEGDAALLWLSHVLEAEKASRGRKRAFVSYEQLMADWRTAMSRLIKQTGIHFTATANEVAPLVDEFLRKDLRHHAKTAGDVALNPILQGWVSDTFEALAQLCVNPSAKNACDTLDRVYQEFRRSFPILQNLLEAAHRRVDAAVKTEQELRQQSEGALAEQTRKAEELDAQLSKFQMALESSREEIDRLTANAREFSAQEERLLKVNDELISDLRVQLGIEVGDNRPLDQLVQELVARLHQNENELKTIRYRLDESKRYGTALAAAHASLADKEIALEELGWEKDNLQRKLDQFQGQMQQYAQTQVRLADYKGLVERLTGERDAYRGQAEAVDRERNQARAEEQRLQDVLDAVYRSTSWRLTAPIRTIGRLPRTAQVGAGQAARSIWHNMPLPTRAKQGFKSAVFKALPFVFRRSGAYRAWQNFTTQPPARATRSDMDGANHTGSTASEHKYVPLLSAAPPTNKPVRVVAFYLPQFHPIPENDEWWGPGFTEWTNVRPAKPQFVGHYQPHVPGELGYYDLRDRSVQKRQIELAKLYGIEGFCFYFYWFAGKRLLEKPVENWLADRSLDLPFCLCWANENWSRRWDGLDREILIGQKHSPEDDLAFIAEAARYLRDPRYIRIDGKPLLLVYRPSLLPSARETAMRWRQWCRENGIGEIFLAYTQSFESVDPSLYDFDAAIEFPPNNSAPPNVTNSVTPLNQDFSANVYDWSCFPERSETYASRKYPLFRSVCPSWDNTARRKSGASIFVNNTPALYRRWLENAIRDTVAHVRNPQERLVFVNAWNEWAEGAHLEPDAANGYAYLQETRNALEKAGGVSPYSRAAQAPVAIVIHAFYPDVLDEILSFVKKLPEQHKIFATTTAEKAVEVEGRLKTSGRNYSLRVLPNRGRDVLPFFASFRDLADEGFEFLIKVHTKKSLHRTDGDVWRRDLYSRLLSLEKVAAASAAFVTDPHLGMVGPEGHYVPMSTYLGSNEERILGIGKQLGLSEGQVRSQPFFAGTMFMARVKAIESIMAMRFAAEEFEIEAGQIDGTLAHAIERGMALSVVANRMRLTTDANLDGVARANERYGHA